MYDLSLKIIFYYINFKSEHEPYFGLHFLLSIIITSSSLPKMQETPSQNIDDNWQFPIMLSNISLFYFRQKSSLFIKYGFEITDNPRINT